MPNQKGQTVRRQEGTLLALRAYHPYPLPYFVDRMEEGDQDRARRMQIQLDQTPVLVVHHQEPRDNIWHIVGRDLEVLDHPAYPLVTFLGFEDDLGLPAFRPHPQMEQTLQVEGLPPHIGSASAGHCDSRVPLWHHHEDQ